jgi:hypothetical protein
MVCWLQSVQQRQCRWRDAEAADCLLVLQLHGG